MKMVFAIVRTTTRQYHLELGTTNAVAPTKIAKLMKRRVMVMLSKLPAMALLNHLKKCVKGNQAINPAIPSQVTHGETFCCTKGPTLTYAVTIGITWILKSFSLF